MAARGSNQSEAESRSVGHACCNKDARTAKSRASYARARATGKSRMNGNSHTHCSIPEHTDRKGMNKQMCRCERCIAENPAHRPSVLQLLKAFKAIRKSRTAICRRLALMRRRQQALR